MFKFTTNEIRDMFISFLVISFGFSMVFSNRDFSALGLFLPITMIGVGTGFILHEIAHKYASIHYGYWAEFKMWPQGLILALITSFMGFIFAAPGAVYTYANNITVKENGVISLAGPVTNIVIALIFLFITVITYPILLVSGETGAIIFMTFTLGFTINSYLALFNLIPFLGLDGSKVIRWNFIIWIATAAIAGYMTYIGMFNQFESTVRMFLGF